MKIIFVYVLLIWLLSSCTLWENNKIASSDTNSLHLQEVASKDGNITQEMRSKYDVVWTFSWGLAKVMLWKKFGYVNLKWEEIIPLEYDLLGDMKLWAIPAFKDTKSWLLSITWSVIIPFQYDFITTKVSDEWMIAVQSGSEYAVFDVSGKRLSDFQVWEFGLSSFFEWGLLKIFRSSYSQGIIYVDSSGVQKKFWEYIVTWWNDWVYEVWNNGLLWFFDKNGNQITPFKYCWGVAEFQSWIRRVCFGDNQKWWFINNQGKEITHLNYDATFNFTNGRWIIEVNRKYWYIDQNWVEVIPPVYEYATDFHNDRAIVKTYNLWVQRCSTDMTSLFGWNCRISRDQYKLEMIDLSGSVISELSYDEVWSFYGNMALVSSGSSIWFIDTSAKLVIPLVYDKDESITYNYDDFNNFSNGFVLLSKNWKRVILYSDWFEKELSKDFGTR